MSALATARVRRGGFQPRAIIAIAALWLLIWDAFSWGNLVNGLLIGLAVTWLLPLPVIPYSGRPHPIALLALFAAFIRDLVVSSTQITKLALSRSRSPDGAIVEVPLNVQSDLYLTMVSVLITLVPGSSVIEVRRAAGILYVHDLDVHSPSDVAAARERVLTVERRLVRAIGSAEEIALVNKGAGS